MKNSIQNTILAGALVLASSGVSAEVVSDGQWYAGGAALQAFVDERGFDEDDTGGKVFGGYKFNQYIAIEGSYYDFSKIGDRSNQLEIDGISLAALGSIDVLPKLSLFGKIGVHEWDADASGTIVSQLNTDDGTDAFFGLGVDYAINDNWEIRGEIEQYEVDDLDVNVASIGFSFVF